MVGVMQDYIIPIIVGVAILGFLTWIIYCFYWFFTRILGLGSFFLKRRLRKKFKDNFEFDGEIIEFCKYTLKNKWKFRELNKITKHNSRRDEILYTYLLLKRLMKEEKIETKNITKKLQDFGGVLK